MRHQPSLDELIELAERQQRTSRVPDYWAGVEDALRFACGEPLATSIAVWVEAEEARNQPT